MSKRENILATSCSHIPFEHPDYLDFLIETYHREKCGTIVHLGDVVDNHGISYHEKNPNGKSIKDEMSEAEKHLVKWFKAFPNMYVCLGNHDLLVTRQAKTAGLPAKVIKDLKEIWSFPRGWKVNKAWVINDVKFQHGTGRSGKYAHILAASDNRMSTVMGHLHTNAGVGWLANDKDIIFGMAVGCGIEKDLYPFDYDKDFKAKPILGCGIVSGNGLNAKFVPMNLGKKIIYI